MPVKVRCKSCQKILNVPDKARGKAVRCPNCQEAVRVPAGGGGSSPQSRPQKSRPAPQREEVGDDDPFGFSLRSAADQRVRVCVKCGAEVDDEVVDCPECYHNVDTGVMSQRMKEIRRRGGLDQADFWGLAWSDSWKWIGKNWKLCLRSGMIWTIFTTLSFFALLMAVYNLAFVGIPPFFFWTAMAVLFSLGVNGWYYVLSEKTIEHTMSGARRKPLSDFHFDFFGCIALGVKSVIWPAVLLSPLMYLAALVLALLATVGGSAPEVVVLPSVVVIGGVYLFGILAFPIAGVHFTQPYTYKAWLTVPMARMVGRNIAPTSYWFLMALCALVPVAVTMVIMHLVWEGGLGMLFIDLVDSVFSLGNWFLDLVGWKTEVEDGERPMRIKAKWAIVAMTVRAIIMMIPIALFVAPFAILYGFAAVFITRANGLFGLYFRDELELVQEQPEGVPCGFGPRYLAFLLDEHLWFLASFVVYKEPIAMIAGWLLNLVCLAGYFYMPPEVFGTLMGVVWPLYNRWMYYSLLEAGPEQATIGKAAQKIKVTNEDGERITIERATGRFFSKIVSGLTLGFGFLMCLWTPRKQCMHDQFNKTLVSWKGEIH